MIDLDRISDVPRIPRIEREMPPEKTWQAELPWAIILAFCLAVLICQLLLHRHDRPEPREQITMYYGETTGGTNER